MSTLKEDFYNRPDLFAPNPAVVEDFVRKMAKRRDFDYENLVLYGPKRPVISYKNFVNFAPVYRAAAYYETNTVPSADIFNTFKLSGTFKKQGSEFLHVLHYKSQGIPLPKIETRLYLQVKNSAIDSFSTYLIQSADKNNLPLYFKFDMYDYRNDGFVVYTNYRDASALVDIIKPYIESHPEDFYMVSNPFMATIGHYIGLGEEPDQQHSSFNGDRARALEAVCLERRTELLAILDPNYRGNVITSTNEHLSKDEYLTFLFRREILKQMNFSIENDDFFRVHFGEIFRNIYNNTPLGKQIVQDTINSYIKAVKNPLIEDAQLKIINSKYFPESTPMSYEILYDFDSKLLNVYSKNIPSDCMEHFYYKCEELGINPNCICFNRSTNINLQESDFINSELMDPPALPCVKVIENPNKQKNSDSEEN